MPSSHRSASCSRIQRAVHQEHRPLSQGAKLLQALVLTTGLLHVTQHRMPRLGAMQQPRPGALPLQTSWLSLTRYHHPVWNRLMWPPGETQSWLRNQVTPLLVTMCMALSSPGFFCWTQHQARRAAHRSASAWGDRRQRMGHILTMCLTRTLQRCPQEPNTEEGSLAADPGTIVVSARGATP